MSKIKDSIAVSGFYSVNFYDLSPKFHTNFHDHDCWELFYVDSGEVNCITESDSRILKSGDVVFHRPGSVHNTVCNGKKSAAIFNVLFFIDSPSMEFLGGKSLRVPERLLPTLKNLINECNKTYLVSEHPLNPRKYVPFGGEQLSRIYLEEFLLLMIRELQNDDQAEYYVAESDTDNVLIDDICEFLSENVYNTVTLKDVCERFHFGNEFSVGGIKFGNLYQRSVTDGFQKAAVNFHFGSSYFKSEKFQRFFRFKRSIFHRISREFPTVPVAAAQ